jgi:hypothetical protein
VRPDPLPHCRLLLVVLHGVHGRLLVSGVAAEDEAAVPTCPRAAERVDIGRQSVALPVRTVAEGYDRTVPSVASATLRGVASWAEVETDAPELASRVREAFGRGKHATMATLRADGSPRISGTEVELTGEGTFRLGSMPGAVKARDLLRDPRVAVHSPTAEPGEGGADWPGEAKIAGVAVALPQEEGGGHAFDIDLHEVVWTGLTDERDALLILSWHPGRGVQERRRE